MEAMNLTFKEREALMVKAENGNAHAATDLADFYEFVALNYDLAIYWYRKAADLGGESEKETYRTIRSAHDS